MGEAGEGYSIEGGGGVFRFLIMTGGQRHDEDDGGDSLTDAAPHPV